MQIDYAILDLKATHSLPVCLMRDFNSHTGVINDRKEPDNTVADATGCDLLHTAYSVDAVIFNPDFTQHRYSQDATAVNKNGNDIISLCCALDFNIIDGRIGSDKYIGNPTCYKASPVL